MGELEFIAMTPSIATARGHTMRCSVTGSRGVAVARRAPSFLAGNGLALNKRDASLLQERRSRSTHKAGALGLQMNIFERSDYCCRGPREDAGAVGARPSERFGKDATSLGASYGVHEAAGEESRASRDPVTGVV